MKKVKILKIALAIGSIYSAGANAQDVKGDLEASAKIENFCSVQARDINFGVLSLPLTAQAASSEMEVLCSNNTAYTIDLAYGGKYGEGTGLMENTEYTVEFLRVVNNINMYRVDKVGGGLNSYVGSIGCSTEVSYSVYLSSQEVADIYGYNRSIEAGSYVDQSGICGNRTGLLRGWEGAYDAPGKQYVISGTPGFEYGVMTGIVKKDQVGYAITIPNNSTKVWNKGVNSYTAKGVGTKQVIQLNAKIVTDKSTSKYLAQDSYLDTVTVTLNY